MQVQEHPAPSWVGYAITIAIIILVAGVATALISIERAQMFRDWWLGLGPDTFRIAACVPLAVGSFIAGSALSRRA